MPQQISVRLELVREALLRHSRPKEEAPAASAHERAGEAPDARTIVASLGRSMSMTTGAPLFRGVFLGGFECSCHRLRNGKRLDLLSATRHAELADADYQRLVAMEMTACREGVSWITSEQRGGYDFESVMSRLRAAERHDVQVIWDLMHFGWPDDVDVFSPRFPARFARYAAAFAEFLANHSSQPAMLAPINEISFLAWAGGDVGCMNPFELARGVEFKVQLVRATIEAIEAVRARLPQARFLQPDPIINVVPSPSQPKTWRRVESDHLLQYQAWDMLAGEVWPSLGGEPRYLDVIGVNFYPDNQFMLDGTTVTPGEARYKPLSAMLLDVWQRYRRPMLISETGSEGPARADWLRYVASESVIALNQGCELHGITLYPLVCHPGWEDDRYCENGLWGYADEHGARRCYDPLAHALREQAPGLLDARQSALASALTGAAGGRA